MEKAEITSQLFEAMKGKDGEMSDGTRELLEAMETAGREFESVLGLMPAASRRADFSYIAHDPEQRSAGYATHRRSGTATFEPLNHDHPPPPASCPVPMAGLFWVRRCKDDHYY